VKTYGTRDILRNPSLLRIDKDSYLAIEDKKRKKFLGLYIGNNLADEFLEYIKKKKLSKCAHKIKENSTKENAILEGSLSDGI
jgi:hypothetical protein